MDSLLEPVPRGETALPESLLDLRLLPGVGGLLDGLLPGAGLPGLLSTLRPSGLLLVGVGGLAADFVAGLGVFTGSELLDLAIDGGLLGDLGSLGGFFVEDFAKFPTDLV